MSQGPIVLGLLWASLPARQFFKNAVGRNTEDEAAALTFCGFGATGAACAARYRAFADPKP